MFDRVFNSPESASKNVKDLKELAKYLIFSYPLNFINTKDSFIFLLLLFTFHIIS